MKRSFLRGPLFFGFRSLRFRSGFGQGGRSQGGLGGDGEAVGAEDAVGLAEVAVGAEVGGAVFAVFEKRLWGDAADEAGGLAAVVVEGDFFTAGGGF